MFNKLKSSVRSIPRPLAAALAVLSAGLLWAYWPTLANLVRRWSSEAQYSHGFLVPVFALALLALRRQQLETVTFGFRWSGLLLLGLGTLLRLIGTRLYIEWLDAASLLPCVAGLTVLLGGKRALRWAWPSIAFLVFMIPLPYSVEVAAALPLQRVATILSTYALQTVGLPAISEGNVILLEEVRIGVVQACSGLSMLETFFALATAVAIVTQRVWWEKLVLVISAAPIAIVVNVIRITVTGILHETVGSELANMVFHDLAGWVMMPMALGILWLELAVLSRLMRAPAEKASLPLSMAAQDEHMEPPATALKRKRQRKRTEKASVPPVT